MKLYLLTQYINKDYDTYDACVVAAESEDDAITIHPSERFDMRISLGQWIDDFGIQNYHGWVDAKDIDKIEVDYLGETEKERGVILASFNAG